jgi:hypothetical protein
LEITKPSVAWPKFLTAVFYAWIKSKNWCLIGLQNVLVHVCLKTATNKLKTFTDITSKTARLK